MLTSIFSEGPDGQVVHIVDPTEVADVVAWLKEQGHQNIRLARSAEECTALLDEWQAETAEQITPAHSHPALGERERRLRTQVRGTGPGAQERRPPP